MAQRERGGESLPEGARIDCNACGGTLYYFPDSYPLAFHCESGHFFTVRDLLDELLAHGRNAPTSTLQSWRGNAMLLRQMAGRALEGGHAFAAADLQETAHRIDLWVAKLQVLLPGGTPEPLSGG
jgi:hypothetical protein